MTDLGALELAAAVVVWAALFGYVNHRFIGLRQTTGLTIMGGLVSLVLVAVNALWPGLAVARQLVESIRAIDFLRRSWTDCFRSCCSLARCPTGSKST